MRVSNRRARILMSLLFLVICAIPLYSQQPSPVKREQIGEVLGRPVYRDELDKRQGVENELHRLFKEPILDEYLEAHRALFDVTPEELFATIAMLIKRHREQIKDDAPKLREQVKQLKSQLKGRGLSEDAREDVETKLFMVQARLEPPGWYFALVMVRSWKFQRHLYHRFGGGRIRSGKFGVESLDAFRTWLEVHEKTGAFRITDLKLRTDFYLHWNWESGLNTDDPDEIKRELLEPDWVPKSISNKDQAASPNRLLSRLAWAS